MRLLLALFLLFATSCVALDGTNHRNCEVVPSFSENGDERVICEVYTNHAALVLIGPSNASLQPPLRARSYVDAGAAMAAAARRWDTSAGGTSLLEAVTALDFPLLASILMETEWCSRLVSFPWSVQTLRSFLSRRVTTVTHEFSIDPSEKLLHGPSVAALAKSTAMVKIISFPPSIPAGANTLICDSEVIADGIKVSEMCSARGISVVPQSVRMLLGLSQATSNLVLEQIGSSGTDFRYVCSIEMAAATSSCLRISSAQADRSQALTLEVASLTSPDATFTYLFLTFCLLTLVQRLVERSKIAQLLVAGLFGVFILGSIAVVYVVRDFGKTKMGKIGIAGMITLGGVAALTEGFISAIVSYVAVEIQQNILVQITLVAMYVLSAAGAHFMLGGRLAQATSIIVCFVRYLAIGLSLSYSPEATVIGSLTALFCYVLARIALGLLFYGVPKAFGLVWRSSDEGEPRDDLPEAATRELEYAKPLAASRMHGSREDKFRQYKREGDEFTRRALEELAAKVRDNPAKYSSKVMNPNQLVKWAGET